MTESNQSSTQASPPPLVAELKPDQFAAWKHHPITHMVMTYLLDFRTSICADHLNRWRAGQLLPGDGEGEARGRAAVLAEIATLEISHIKQFYEVEEADA